MLACATATPGLTGRLKAILEAPTHREDLITVDRQRKGDMQLRRNTANGWVVRAQAVDGTVLARFVEIRWLEAWHAFYALGFMELRHAFLAPVRFKSNSIYLAQIFGTTVGTSYAAEMYESVYHLLGKTRETAVQYACETEFLKEKISMDVSRFIINSFEVLLTSMDHVRREMRGEQ